MELSHQGNWWSITPWPEDFGAFLQDLVTVEDVDQVYAVIVSSALTLFGADGAILYPFCNCSGIKPVEH